MRKTSKSQPLSERLDMVMVSMAIMRFTPTTTKTRTVTTINFTIEATLMETAMVDLSREIEISYVFV
ncbi:hypothetical protein AtNW77_Chr5g0129951 [Arabidopsis thaliana]